MIFKISDLRPLKTKRCPDIGYVADDIMWRRRSQCCVSRPVPAWSPHNTSVSDGLQKSQQGILRLKPSRLAAGNARLAAIRSFFHHVATDDPAALAIAQRVLAIPVKRADRR